jgi:anti-sigma regulatory factor (Ser/Thr protein kinase)
MNNAVADRHEQSFTATASSARLARVFVRDALRSHEVGPSIIGNFQLVVSELTANAIEHGNGSDVVVLVELDDPTWLALTVDSRFDGADGSVRHLLTPELWNVADAQLGSGRGLGIVSHLMDRVDVTIEDGSLRIRCLLSRPSIER